MILRRIACLILLAAAPFIFLNSAIAEESVPAPMGDIYVQDFANILSGEEKARLIEIGRTVEDNTGSQVAVLTVNTIDGRSIEEYANEAFRSYRLGTSKDDNGVLLVVALADKKIRIEVGYGLEGQIPDGKAGRILDEQALPYLKKGRTNEAIINTYTTLANEVSGTEEFTGAESSESGQGSSIPGWLFFVIVAGVIILDMTFFGGTLSYVLLSIISRGGGGGGGGHRGGGGGSSGGGGASRGW